MGRHNAHLFRFAMEECGCGPPKGMMNIEDDEGVAAFLRAVQNHLSIENTFSPVKSISEYVKWNRIADNLAYGKELNDRFGGVLEHEGNNIPICKASVNPLLIFLHVDQGCFENVSFSPFVSPFANNRSIHQEHVHAVIEEVLTGNAIVSQEDLAIMAFDVVLDDTPPTTNGVPPIIYRCTLNRDHESSVTVMGKKASEATHQSLDNLYNKVSGTTQNTQSLGVSATCKLIGTDSVSTSRYSE